MPRIVLAVNLLLCVLKNRLGVYLEVLLAGLLLMGLEQEFDGVDVLFVDGVQQGVPELHTRADQ